MPSRKFQQVISSFCRTSCIISTCLEVNSTDSPGIDWGSKSAKLNARTGNPSEHEGERRIRTKSANHRESQTQSRTLNAHPFYASITIGNILIMFLCITSKMLSFCSRKYTKTNRISIFRMIDFYHKTL